MDVEGTTATLKNLTPSVTYELVVKAGNTNGTSVLSEPITFIVADKFIIKTNGAQPSTEIGESNIFIGYACIQIYVLSNRNVVVSIEFAFYNFSLY